MNARVLLALVTGLFAATALRSGESFDQSHRAFDQILQPNVHDGRVNYRALKAAPDALVSYLSQLAAVSEADFDAWPEPDRLAFLINLYNATTLKLIVDHYPLKSIRSIGWLPGSAWKQDVVHAFGREFTLDDLEHGTIRPNYRDARVHFALVCAARGCPPLRPEAYTGSKLDAQLDDQGRVFFGQSNKNRLDAAAHAVYLSPIFKWFHEDFEEQAGSVLKFSLPFWPEEPRRALEKNLELEIRYTDYDWSLNEDGAKAE